MSVIIVPTPDPNQKREIEALKEKIELMEAKTPEQIKAVFVRKYQRLMKEYQRDKGAFWTHLAIFFVINAIFFVLSPGIPFVVVAFSWGFVLVMHFFNIINLYGLDGGAYRRKVQMQIRAETDAALNGNPLPNKQEMVTSAKWGILAGIFGVLIALAFFVALAFYTISVPDGVFVYTLF